MSENGTGYVGIDKDYFVSVKEVLNITAETGALETQNRVRELPHADVVEARHGEWVYCESEEGHDGYRCSECDEFIPWEYGEYDIDCIKEVHYCPNCGARMDGDNDE